MSKFDKTVCRVDEEWDIELSPARVGEWRYVNNLDLWPWLEVPCVLVLLS